MKSRNTAPRLSTDLGPGCFPQPNKPDIPSYKCWLSRWHTSSFQYPYSTPRLHPFSAQAISSTPTPCAVLWVPYPLVMIMGKIPVVRLECSQEQMPSD